MISNKQIAALKYLIFNAKQTSNLAKQILAFLIDQSKGLTEEVYLTITVSENYTGKEIRRHALDMDNMFSCGSTTHLNEIMAAVGTDFCFSLHYGSFDGNGRFDTKGQFDDSNVPLRYTFWCGKGFYSKTAKATSISRVELESIDLKKPGLYLNLEKYE